MAMLCTQNQFSIKKHEIIEFSKEDVLIKQENQILETLFFHLNEYARV